jgi:hypothetical protein
MTTSSTGRFSIGQKLIVVAFRYAEKETMFVSVPLLFDNFMPSKIHLKELTVTEHHKVPDGYDEKETPDCNYDGYVLKDSTGQKWHNQYPLASYGQTTDNANWTFERAVNAGEDVDALVSNSQESPLDYELLTIQLDRMYRGLKNLKEHDILLKDHEGTNNIEKVNQIKELFEKIDQQLKEDFPLLTYVNRPSEQSELREIKFMETVIIPRPENVQQS